MPLGETRCHPEGIRPGCLKNLGVKSWSPSKPRASFHVVSLSIDTAVEVSYRDAAGVNCGNTPASPQALASA